MPFSRSPTSYFDRNTVHSLIQDIADQQSLVVYAGAGVSIDRTGLSWRELINRLMKEHVVDDAIRQSIMNTYLPLEAASIVCQMYADQRQARPMAQILHQLRSMLYGADLATGRTGQINHRARRQVHRRRKKGIRCNDKL